MKQPDHYVIDGKKYDRVTAVLGYFQTPKLVDWKLTVGKKEANKRSKEALKIGTAVHKYAETGKMPAKASVDVRNCVEAYNRWVAEHKPVVLSREVTVHSKTWGVAGTYDLLLDSGILVDIKTSREIKLEHWLQLGTYAFMISGIEKLAVLRLDKNMGFYEYIEKPFSYEYQKVFCGLLTAYRYFNQGGDDDDDNGVTENQVEGGQELDEPEVPDAGTVRGW